MKMHEHREAVQEVAKSIPPVTASGIWFLGLPLERWMVILTICWVLMQMGGFIYDRFIKGRSAP